MNSQMQCNKENDLPITKAQAYKIPTLKMSGEILQPIDDLIKVYPLVLNHVIQKI
jgi:hypothetical protein